MQELIDNILKELKGKIHKSATEIVFDGIRKRKEVFIRSGLDAFPIEKYLPPKLYEEYGNLSIKKIAGFHDDFFSSLPQKHEVKLKQAEENLSANQKVLKDNFILCRTLDSNELVLFSKSTREIPDWICPEAYVDALPSFISKEIVANSPMAILHFDAYDVSPFKRENREGISLIRLNAYKPPEWQKRYPEAKSEWLSEPLHRSPREQLSLHTTRRTARRTSF